MGADARVGGGAEMGIVVGMTASAIVCPLPEDRGPALPVAEREKLSLADLYWYWFDVRPATIEGLREQAYRLRYQVYCMEHGFEDPADYPEGLETDAYDERAVTSVLIHRPTGLVAGTVRLVLPRADAPGESFAMQEICKEPLIKDPERFPVARMGEISRFCISKHFRRRLQDLSYPNELDHVAPRLSRREERRLLPHMTLGLIEALVRMNVENGLTHWCAAMEPQLLRLLARMGIHFEPIGPIVAHHGMRQPCVARVVDMSARVKAERPDVWDVVTDQGRLAAAFHRIEGEYARRPSRRVADAVC